METETMEYYPVALTIAGSDSGGGAGIQADLRTFSAFGVYGCSVITAITAQNPHQVLGIMPVETGIVRQQLEAVFSDMNIRAIKIGMLQSADIVKCVAEFLKEVELPVILDPVMVSTSGHRLLERDAVDSMKDLLLPLADWITPNRREAELLSGIAVSTEDDALQAGQICSEKWNCNCVVKGGHFKGQKDERMVDFVVTGNQRMYRLSSPLVEDSKATHGTGCTFSSAFCASLALGSEWQDALKDAKGFVYGSLQDAVILGDDVEAMYPPLKNYANEVKLEKIKKREKA